MFSASLKTKLKLNPLKKRYASYLTKEDFESQLRSSKIFSNQDKLLRLPVPSLNSTLEKYITSVEPLCNEEELAQTKRYVQQFISNPRWGNDLQSQLETLDRLSPTSFIEGFWDTMYLEIRDPIVLNVNPAFIFSNNINVDLKSVSKQLGTSPKVAKAALLIHGAAHYINLIKTGHLEPYVEKTVPLDMSQYPKLFSSTRIPGYSRDIFKNVIHLNVKHIIVMRNNRFYVVNILDDHLNPLSVEHIASQLNSIECNEESSRRAELFVGSFTGSDRLNWSWNYSRLESLGDNRKSLDLIENSLFSVSFESYTHESIENATKEVLMGDSCSNRYYDKSIQMIFYEDGTTGINFEHTGFDGHTVLSFVEYIQNFKYNEIYLPISRNNSTHQLEFMLDRTLEREIRIAESRFYDLYESYDLTFVHWDQYGKKFISENKMSPDAFVQMAFQLAYYRHFKKSVSTYESSNMKHYNHGRTECIRSTTNESKRFAEAFDDPRVNNNEKLSLLNNAIQKHVNLAKMSKQGELIDRHLQALKWLSYQQYQRQAEYQMPTLFTDPIFSRYFRSVMSTSNCGSTALDSFAFGPVCSDGLGLGYMIKNNDIPITVTSFTRSSSDFGKELKKALKDMKDLIERTKN